MLCIISVLAIAMLFGCGGTSVNNVTTSNTSNNSTSLENLNNTASDASNSNSSADVAQAKVSHVASYSEQMSGNQLWCAPMNLCWNEAMAVNGGKPLYGIENPTVDSLNSQPFTKDMLSDEYYYIYAGLVKSPQDIVDKINQELQEKFNQESEILRADDINPGAYLFYSMLYRKFNYATPFEKLDPSVFTTSDGQVESDIDYFGFDKASSTDNDMVEQVTVLYYDDNDSHAVMLDTADGDKVIFVRSPQGDTPQDIFKNAMKKAENYEGEKTLSGSDKFAAPNISIDITDEFNQLRGAMLKDSNGAEFEVEKALQKTKLKMDNEGGEVKSEAVIVTDAITAGGPKPKYYIYDGEYAMFLVDGEIEANKTAFATGKYTDTNPYLVAKVSNAKLFQE